ncbi:biotin--[acetyl-CoA-carboxylase] ligase [Calidifontibacter sp. DB0510]|uniref:biotin--[biotin carboxyl-carrier protein] ligase n=1 Tax=Metallococcus carri TaxID=1656884 RepID=A0A967B4S6_9MICO|nr:biotin--[acetyl-CoA-carboxylase] ligase [Metallococcus carri]NHN54626.1 biotin--[acetyl-CoA-carboxylase] ligase [Metallococcus carri]NOP36535.1 biotin--[acetyl-CoA-carboxylase] ligase [Calidifontibacter sp. DB2511S]
MSHDADGEGVGRGAPPPWSSVERVASIDSTNAALLRDPRPWRALVADYQTDGRGRRDRAWEAPPGASLAFSAALPLPHETDRWGWVPLLVGLAARRAIATAAGLDVGLKWPNDVLVRDGDQWLKLGGILCNATGGDFPVVVVGVGINLFQTREQLPTTQATSIALCGKQIDTEELINALLVELARVHDAWHTDRLDDEYRAACVTIGQEVRVQVADDREEIGDAVDIDTSGRLILETPRGRTPHAVGDVVHVRPREPRERHTTEQVRAATVERAAFVDSIEQRLMGAPRTLRRADVSQAAGIPPEVSRRFWRALGFANARDEDVVFSESDVAAVRGVMSLIADGLVDETTALGITRAVGRSTDRMAMWVLQLVTDMFTADGEVDETTARSAADRAAIIADRFTPLLDYVWRRNLTVAISRLIADSEPESHIGVVRTVGFADLVNFTQLVRQMGERELAALIVTFETIASDVVSQHGGALVKTVGDEVLYSHTSIEGAVAIAVDLIEATAANDLLPRMRIGMATGRVLARLGDIYGTTVNRAARLTTAAAPGTILADADIARTVAMRPDLDTRPYRAVQLSGLGELTPWTITRHGTSDPDTEGESR